MHALECYVGVYLPHCFVNKYQNNTRATPVHIIFQLSLEWRHNERHGVSNHRVLDCLLDRLFRRRSKNTSKLHVTGLCEGNSPVTGEFPAQKASNAESVSIWWRHHFLPKVSQRGSWLDMCHPTYRRTTLVLLVTWITTTFTYYGSILLNTALLEQNGFNATTSGIQLIEAEWRIYPSVN